MKCVKYSGFQKSSASNAWFFGKMLWRPAPYLATSKALWWMSGGSVKGWYAPLTRSNICRNWENSPIYPHTMKPNWFSIHSSLCSWNSAAAAEKEQLPEWLVSSGSSCVMRKRRSWCKQHAGVDVCLLERACMYAPWLHLSCSLC